MDPELYLYVAQNGCITPTKDTEIFYVDFGFLVKLLIYLTILYSVFFLLISPSIQKLRSFLPGNKRDQT